MNWIKQKMLKYMDRYRLAMQKDILAIQYLAPLTRGYLPWSVSSMRPSSIVVILNEILLNQRVSILECGCGVSTVYIAALLSSVGGHLYTIENNAAWAKKISELLARQDLAEPVTMIHAPLTKTSLSWAGSLWYDEAVVREQLGNVLIDLLVVDGPPADEEKDKHARYPAVPFVRDHLAEDYTIMLHDIIRPGEEEILKRWEKELGINFERRYRDGFIGVGKSSQALSV